MQYFIYIFFNIILLVTFIGVGKVEAKSNKSFWKLYIPAIISFVLILGARYKRGADYVHYQDVYNNGLGYEQHLFSLINNVLHFFEFSDTAIFFAYSLIFIVGAGFILKYYRELSAWLMPLFLMAYIVFDEWFIRQALGYSFIFVFLRYLFDTECKVSTRVIICLISVYCSYLIHSGNIFTVAVITLIYFLYKKPFNYKVCIVLYLFASYYFQYNTDFSLVETFLHYITGFDSRMDQYIMRSDNWFSSDAIQSDYYREGFIKLFQTLGECSMFYFGYKVLSTDSHPNDNKVKSLVILFNVYVIGSILGQAFFVTEIPKRMASTLYMFWCFPLAYILYTTKFKLLSVKDKFLFFFLLFWMYEYAKYVLYRVDNVYTFIWDKI